MVERDGKRCLPGHEAVSYPLPPGQHAAARPPSHVSSLNQKRLGFALFLFLLWRAAAAADELARRIRGGGGTAVRQALTFSEDERIRATLDRQQLDKGLDRPAGYLHELYSVLRDEVPSGAWIFAVEKDGLDELGLSALRFLLYPRLLYIQRRISGDELPWRPERTYVLDFGGSQESELEEHFEPVARGPDWALWH